MGNQLNCLAQCHASHESHQRLLALQKGAYFSRKKQVLGLTTGSERIHLRLSGDEKSLLWKVHDSIKEPAKIDLSAINVVQAQAALGLCITSLKGDTLLEVEAESAAVRDEWVTSLQLLCEGNGAVEETAAEAESKLKFSQVLQDRAQKQVYWTKRTQELEDRKRDAEERKKRFAGAGMKYTALAMSSRTSSATTAASAAEP